MKTSTSLLRRIAVAIALSTTAITAVEAQTTATTIPVGFMTVTLPVAASPTAPSNTTVSIPLYNTPDFNGAVASVIDSTNFTLTGATFGASGETLVPALNTANPRLVRVKTSGTPSHVGKIFVVTAASGSQLTVRDNDALITNIASFVSVGDTCEIVPANTFAKLFGPNLAGATSVFAAGKFFVTGASASAADNLLVWNGTTWLTYYNSGSNWRVSPAFTNKNDDIIFPDDGLFVIHRDTVNALTLTLQGTVPSTSEQTYLPAGSTFISNRFPTDITLVATGIQSTPGWQQGASAAAGDNVFIWESPTWGVYYWTGVNWRKSPSFLSADTKVIPASTAVFITKKTSAAGTLSQALPYVP